jgi:glycosyltransferase involved in cell wall biosynthesis
MEPKISVVMTVCKPNLFALERALIGIWNQTCKDFELIVVLDDPKNDNVKSFFQNQTDPRLRFYVNEANKGEGYSVNKGVSLAKAPYIAIHHDDDYSYPMRFEKQYAFLENNPSVDVLGTGMEYVNMFTGEVLYNRIYDNDIDKVIRIEIPTSQPSLMVRKHIFYDCGFMEEVFCPDYDVSLLWYSKGVKFYNLSEILLTYYQGDNSATTQPHKLIRAHLVAKWKYHHILKFGFIDYLYMLAQYMLFLLPAKWVRPLFYSLKRNSWY